MSLTWERITGPSPGRRDPSQNPFPAVPRADRLAQDVDVLVDVFGSVVRVFGVRFEQEVVRCCIPS